MPEAPESNEHRSGARQRWDAHTAAAEHAGDHLPRAHGVLHFTDATGAPIVEHSGGRFRFCMWTQKWEPLS